MPRTTTTTTAASLTPELQEIRRRYAMAALPAVVSELGSENPTIVATRALDIADALMLQLGDEHE